MLWYQHLIFTLAIASFITHNYIGLIIILFFSLFPDIDADKSFLLNRFGLLKFIVKLIIKLYLFPFGLINKHYNRHRGIMHSLFSAILISIIIYIIAPSLALYVLLGYVLHLMEDAITVSGIEPLSPFSSYEIRGLINLSNSLHIFLLNIICVLLLYFLYNNTSYAFYLAIISLLFFILISKLRL